MVVYRQACNIAMFWDLLLKTKPIAVTFLKYHYPQGKKLTPVEDDWRQQ